jgi:hypothetical protein
MQLSIELSTLKMLREFVNFENPGCSGRGGDTNSEISEGGSVEKSVKFKQICPWMK